MISCIILAAGLSQRFGSPKALAQIQGKSVIEHLQNKLLKTKVDEIVVVLGNEAKNVRSLILENSRIRYIYNNDYLLGQTSTFQVGLSKISLNTRGVMLLPVDCPAIKQETINRLIDVFKERSPLILIPNFNGQKGHPPIFHRNLIKKYLSLKPDQGINSVAHDYEQQTIFFDVNDSGVIASFNTKAELEQIKSEII